jgi:outer membrane lipoprotein-sorting protein
MEMKKLILLMSLILSLVLLISACNSTPALTAQQIMDNAFAKMAEVNTVTFTLTEDMTLLGQSVTATGTGFTELPDKSYSALTMSIAGQTMTTETLQLAEGEVYMKMGSDTNWTRADVNQTATSGNALMFYAKADPELAKQWYLNPVLEGTESVGGINCYKITYELDAEEAFNQILTGIGDTLTSLGMTIEAGEATGAMYVGTTDFLVYKNTGVLSMTLTMQGTTVSITADVTAEFSKFNEPVTFPTP